MPVAISVYIFKLLYIPHRGGTAVNIKIHWPSSCWLPVLALCGLSFSWTIANVTCEYCCERFVPTYQHAEQIIIWLPQMFSIPIEQVYPLLIVNTPNRESDKIPANSNDRTIKLVLGDLCD